MDLTPIIVRGRRRPPGETVPAPPLKRRNIAKQDRGGKTARARSANASVIEKSMPLEILERIFWYSENVNFPRASLRLGWLLSSPSTLRRTFLTAFAPFWHLGVPKRRLKLVGSRNLAPPEADVESDGGNADFQTDLLTCSWTTIDLILDCWDIWVRQRPQRQALKYKFMWDLVAGLRPADHMQSFTTARQYFEQDYADFIEPERPFNLFGASWRFLLDDPARTRGLLCARLEVPTKNSAEIPDALITGPWDGPALRKFFWIVQAGARLSPRQTWELGLEGFQEALRNPRRPNFTALRLLRIIGALEGWPRHVAQAESNKLGSYLGVMDAAPFATLHELLSMM
ncbi:hypothetical protein F5Y17DRAFT_414406 [Xylariaceae sp. FL0594]|nr:hypothetical protein F5Y17DRAFT_414406 [Xylariaceae sp. FL0594]